MVNRVTVLDSENAPNVTVPLDPVQPLVEVNVLEAPPDATDQLLEVSAAEVGILNFNRAAVVPLVGTKFSGVFDVPSYALIVKYLPIQLLSAAVAPPSTFVSTNEVTVKVSAVLPVFVNETDGVTVIALSQAAVLTKP